MLLSFRNITIILFLVLSQHLFSTDFEGKITMVKETCFDTVYYNYFISKNNIRIEEMDTKKEIKGIYLVKLDKEEVYFVHPQKEMYTKIRKHKFNSQNQNQFEIRKTENFKIINGSMCFQWRVKNKSKNTEFAYWVTQNNFAFFEKMVKVLNQHDLYWEFFNKIPENQGFFPMISEERNLVRDMKMTTEVLQINRKNIDRSLFFIPSDYKLMTM